MTQEEKQLLLQNLCARLPYGVVVNTPKGDGHLCSINQTLFGNEYGVNIKATRRDYFNGNECDIKPYLRSMSSMTEKEMEEYKGTFVELPNEEYLVRTIRTIDWLNAHHFDFRNLIERGLAIDCTGLNVY